MNRHQRQEAARRRRARRHARRRADGARPAPPSYRERLVAYGARCTWWDDKPKAARLPSGLPCCPYCSGVLFECEEAAWLTIRPDWEPPAAWGISAEEYPRWLDWQRGRQCYPSQAESVAAWRADTDQPNREDTP